MAGLLGPWIGAIADARGSRRALLAAATVPCGLLTVALTAVGAGDVALGIALFAGAHLAHLVATSLYNSYLPLIAAPDRLAACPASPGGFRTSAASRASC